MEIRPLNQDELDVQELESRIELMVAVPNEDGCWTYHCDCDTVCRTNGCSPLV